MLLADMNPISINAAQLLSTDWVIKITIHMASSQASDSSLSSSASIGSESIVIISSQTNICMLNKFEFVIGFAKFVCIPIASCQLRSAVQHSWVVRMNCKLVPHHDMSCLGTSQQLGDATYQRHMFPSWTSCLKDSPGRMWASHLDTVNCPQLTQMSAVYTSARALETLQ